MTALNNLPSIAVQGLIPQNGNNGKLIGEEKNKVFSPKDLKEQLPYMWTLILYLIR
jgi:4-hydroxy-L-threonine phosphate dehydrogenase PdxA